MVISPTCGRPIWSSSPKIELLTYSDASNVGWAGYIVKAGQYIARGNWSECESRCSSSFREIRAIRLVLESFSSVLKGKECKHRSDNQSVVVFSPWEVTNRIYKGKP